MVSKSTEKALKNTCGPVSFLVKLQARCKLDALLFESFFTNFIPGHLLMD